MYSTRISGGIHYPGSVGTIFLTDPNNINWYELITHDLGNSSFTSAVSNNFSLKSSAVYKDKGDNSFQDALEAYVNENYIESWMDPAVALASQDFLKKARYYGAATDPGAFEYAPSAGTIQFSAATYSKAEGNSGTSTVAITVTRTGGSDGAVSVSYASSNGTATAGSDYTATAGTLNWVDGDAADKTILISISGDTTPETDETFTVTLSSPTGGAILGTSVTTVTIANDEPEAPSITTQPQSQTVIAGDNVTFTVSVRGTAPLYYQWKKDDVNTGANSAMLSLSNVKTNDEGNYTVLITNSLGSVTSSVATLSVIPNVAPVAATFTYTDPFERGPGALTNFPALWSFGGNVSGEIKAGIGEGSSRGLELVTGDGESAELTQYIQQDTQSVVWIDVTATLPASTTPLQLPADATYGFSLAPAGGGMADVLARNGANWVLLGLCIDPAASHRYTVKQNFSGQVWDLKVDGILATTNSLAFASTRNHPAYFRIIQAANRRSVFDNLSLSLSEPGVDGNTTYADWATGYGLTGSSADDADGDRINNFLEYALRGNPTNPADTGTFRFGTAPVGGTDFFDYVYARRNGLTYTLQLTTNLVTGPWVTNGYTELPAAPLDADFETVTNRIDTSDSNEKFIRLRVE